uniref:Uncharacterized protein n=1 Tax=Caenorhabditis japonica TaxID=281687 RepID=A0A8R1IKA0_CAEJA
MSSSVWLPTRTEHKSFCTEPLLVYKTCHLKESEEEDEEEEEAAAEAAAEEVEEAEEGEEEDIRKKNPQPPKTMESF